MIFAAQEITLPKRLDGFFSARRHVPKIAQQRDLRRVIFCAAKIIPHRAQP